MASRGNRGGKKVSWSRRGTNLVSRRKRSRGVRVSPVAILVFCAICSAFPQVIGWIALGAGLYFGGIAASTVLRASER